MFPHKPVDSVIFLSTMSMFMQQLARSQMRMTNHRRLAPADAPFPRGTVGPCVLPALSAHAAQPAHTHTLTLTHTQTHTHTHVRNSHHHPNARKPSIAARTVAAHTKPFARSSWQTLTANWHSLAQAAHQGLQEPSPVAGAPGIAPGVPAHLWHWCNECVIHLYPQKAWGEVGVCV